MAFMMTASLAAAIIFDAVKMQWVRTLSSSLCVVYFCTYQTAFIRQLTTVAIHHSLIVLLLA